MALDREAIYSALAARLQGVPGIVTFSRVWQHWDDVPPLKQPALFMPQGNETPTNAKGQPPAWRLTPALYIYARRDTNPDASRATNLNALLQAVEAALERQPDEVAPFGGPEEWFTTLGGLVSYCRIGGTIETDEGIMGGQAVAVVPLDILATS